MEKLKTKQNATVISEQLGEDNGNDVLLHSRFADEESHSQSAIEAVKNYKYALLWALYINISVIMSGYDPQVIGSSVGIEQFRENFGYKYDGRWVVNAAWLSAFSYAIDIGNVFGSLLGGHFIDWWGNKTTLLIASSTIIGTIFIQFFSNSPPLLFVGELLSGIPLGMFPIITSVYTSEVAPLALRGAFTAFVNLGFVVGQLLATGILNATQARDDKWSYKIPFAIQWVWPLIILSLLPFCPESPWWLVKKRKFSAARKNLLKLTSTSDERKLDNIMASMIQTIELEKENSNSASYLECFRGTNLRRTVIAAMSYSIQPLSGQVLVINYCVYFFENAGLKDNLSFALSLGLSAIGFVSTIISWFLMHKLGRRNLYLYPMMIMSLLLFIIGFVDIPKNYQSANAWAESVLMLVWTLVYDVSIGPLAFVYISEISPSKLRAKIVSIANIAVVVTIIIFTVVVPYLINTDEGNLRGKSCFVFGGISLLCTVWVYFELPETRGRTYEELDIMFYKKISARNFKGFDVKRHMKGYDDYGNINVDDL